MKIETIQPPPTMPTNAATATRERRDEPRRDDGASLEADPPAAGIGCEADRDPLPVADDGAPTPPRDGFGVDDRDDCDDGDDDDDVLVVVVLASSPFTGHVAS